MSDNSQEIEIELDEIISSFDDDFADIDLDHIRASAEYAEESLVADAQSKLARLMDKEKISRAALAKAMGVSRARITQMLSPECKNFTVRLLARAAHAMGDQFHIELISESLRATPCADATNPQLAGAGPEWEILFDDKPANENDMGFFDEFIQLISARTSTVDEVNIQMPEEFVDPHLASTIFMRTRDNEREFA